MTGVGQSCPGITLYATGVESTSCITTAVGNLWCGRFVILERSEFDQNQRQITLEVRGSIVVKGDRGAYLVQFGSRQRVINHELMSPHGNVSLENST